MPAAKSKKAGSSQQDLLALCFDLIAEDGWCGFSFDGLASNAGMKLADIRKSFKSRAAVLDALSLRLDEAMLAAEREDLADLPLRDRVFELMMSRLEAMTPFRAGLIRLAKDARRDPELALNTACRLDRSMVWLQDAAGLRAAGLRSRLQRHLLAAVYLKTLKTWSKDESSDLAGTMASLDKNLRRVESFANLGATRQ